MGRQVIAVLGAGPHGRQIASFFEAKLYDDNRGGFSPCREGAQEHPYLLGAAFPAVRREIMAHLPFDADPWEMGVVLFPGCQVGQAVAFGFHTHVLYNAVVSHGCQLGSFVTVCSGAALCGEVSVGDDVFVGANAVVIHGGIAIGAGATVGAGAVVVEDVPAGATVVGNPARVLVAS